MPEYRRAVLAGSVQATEMKASRCWCGGPGGQPRPRPCGRDAEAGRDLSLPDHHGSGSPARRGTRLGRPSHRWARSDVHYDLFARPSAGRRRRTARSIQLIRPRWLLVWIELPAIIRAFSRAQAQGVDQGTEARQGAEAVRERAQAQASRVQEAGSQKVRAGEAKQQKEVSPWSGPAFVDSVRQTGSTPYRLQRLSLLYRRFEREPTGTRFG